MSVKPVRGYEISFMIFLRMINDPIFIVSILRVGAAGEHIEIGTK